MKLIIICGIAFLAVIIVVYCCLVAASCADDDKDGWGEP